MSENDRNDGHKIQQLAMKLSLAASRATSIVPQLLQEIPMILYSPELERAMSDRYYNSKLDEYADRHQRAGLYPFEIAVLNRYAPPPPAHFFLPGAGTGREMLALLDRGYTVDGIEPVEAMAEFANRTLAGRAEVKCMTLQEWVREPSGRYDGIFTGWHLWAHMNRHVDRIDALRAFRQVCDSGPLLVSYLRIEHVNFSFDGAPPRLDPVHPTSNGRLKRLTRDVLRTKILRRDPLERGIWLNDDVFKHISTEQEIRAEGAETGWRLEHYSHDGTEFGHAVLFPA